MASGGGGGCACPRHPKPSSIATSKHALSSVPAILLLRGSEESTREWQEELERSRDSASLAVALQSKRRAATQPLQKFPRSYLGAGRGREPLGGAGLPWAESGRRGEEGRGGERQAALPRGLPGFG